MVISDLTLLCDLLAPMNEVAGDAEYQDRTYPAIKRIGSYGSKVDYSCEEDL